MNKKLKIVLTIVMVVFSIGLIVQLLQGHSIDILQPSGQIAHKQRGILIFASLLALVVVIPVFILTIFIALKYREDNQKPTKYTPDWSGNNALELVWWGIPALLIVTLSVVTWVSSHSLDPFKPLNSKVTPLTVQVVALDWKWLFIYPEQNIAVVNSLTIPEKTPINFEITADAPMNSFWIPSLGGQIYAMPGMVTKLHLDATKTGTYKGSSANISGRGFAGMNFPVFAVSKTEFEGWATKVGRSDNSLSQAKYDRLSKPSENTPVTYFGSVDHDIFSNVMHKYMSRDKSGSQAEMIMQGVVHD